MKIKCHAGTIELVDERAYSFGSADNTRTYPFEENFTSRNRPASIHGVLLDGEPLAVFASDGGVSGVHEHSGVGVSGALYIAVGDRVVCLNPAPFQYKWSLQVDPVACFGIHYDERHQALISHGELKIARLSEDGRLLWSAGGDDIFSGELSLLPQFIEVVDFDGRTYRFEYGRGVKLQTP